MGVARGVAARVPSWGGRHMWAAAAPPGEISPPGAGSDPTLGGGQYITGATRLPLA